MALRVLALLSGLSVVQSASLPDEVTSAEHDLGSCKSSVLIQSRHQLATESSLKEVSMHGAPTKKTSANASVTGANATLDQQGYSLVLQLGNLEQMESYVTRIANELGLTVQDPDKLGEFSSKHLDIKKPEFSVLVGNLLHAFRKDEWLKSSVPKTTASEAALTEAGFQAVQQLHSNEEMEAFMKRYVKQQNLLEVSNAELSGIAPFYSGMQATQNFARFNQELGGANNNSGKSESIGQDGYEKVIKSGDQSIMEKFTNRLAEAMGLTVTDEQGLIEFSAKQAKKTESNFSQMVVDMLNSVNASTWVQSTVEPVQPEAASFSEVGYKAVVQRHSNEDMTKYIQKYLKDSGMQVTNLGDFVGVVPYYSGFLAIQNFSKLQQELRQVSQARNSWLIFKGIEKRTDSISGLIQKGEPDAKKEDKDTDTAKKFYMDQKGYEQVVKTKDENEMSSYVERIATGLGLKVMNEQSLEEFSSDQVKKPSNFSVLVHAILEAAEDEKAQWMKAEVAKTTGDKAELSEQGYKSVLQQQNTTEMVEFMKRYLCKNNLEVKDTGKLPGMAPFYDGQRSIQTFQRMKEELTQIQGLKDTWLVSKDASKIEACTGKKNTEEDKTTEAATEEDKTTEAATEEDKTTKAATEEDKTANSTEAATEEDKTTEADAKGKTGTLKQYDHACFEAGSDMASRDAACAEGLKCARKGWDKRDFGDCKDGHCCSKAPENVALLAVAGHEEKPPAEDKAIDTAKAVYMDQKGYETVVKTKEVSEMTFYVSRIADSLGMRVHDKMKMADFSANQLKLKTSSNFTALVSNILDAAEEATWVKSEVTKTTGDKAELTAEGFKSVVQLQSKEEMANFMRRYLCENNLEVKGKGKLLGMAPFYNGEQSVQSFQRMKDEFKDLKKSKDSWLISKDASQIEACSPEKKSEEKDAKEDEKEDKKADEEEKKEDDEDETEGSTGVLEQYDKSCFDAGTDVASRDASCKNGMTCSRKGWNNRNYGDCPDFHCCSKVPKK